MSHITTAWIQLILRVRKESDQTAMQCVCKYTAMIAIDFAFGLVGLQA